MPSLDQFAGARNPKMLYIGHSGSGKTGSLAALAKAGYKLRILDFDNGLSPLVQYTPADVRKNIEYETFTDTIEFRAGSPRLPKGADAFRRAMEKLDDWDDYGAVTEWQDDVVLVIDSLTFMSRSALRQVQHIAANFGKNPTQPNWGDAQRMVDNCLSLLYSDQIKCSVVVTAHLKFFGSEEDGSLMGLPESLGKSLSPTIPRFFDIMVQAKTVGSGSNRRRTIQTRSSNMVELKVPAEVPEELPLETGLATLFEVIRNRPHPGNQE